MGERMNTEVLIEMMGYVSSLLVLVSFSMSSVVKLRVINSVGSLIFTVYAILIHSYPTAFMNLCLIGVNLYYLMRLRKTGQHYDLVNSRADDAFLHYILKHYGEDISACFPGWNSGHEMGDAAYIVCCDAAPAGVLLGKRQEEGTLEITLDYSMPAYRDCSVGAYLYEKLSAQGIRKLIFSGHEGTHGAYLKKMGFVQENGAYVKHMAP